MGNNLTTIQAPVIRSNIDLAEALLRVDQLWGSEVGTPLGDELDVLITLVREYEFRNFPMEYPTPVESVIGLMDRKGLRRKDLLPIFGTLGRLSEFLNGKRPLSKNQIKALHQIYGIPYESLMG